MAGLSTFAPQTVGSCRFREKPRKEVQRRHGHRCCKKAVEIEYTLGIQAYQSILLYNSSQLTKREQQDPRRCTIRGLPGSITVETGRRIQNLVLKRMS